MTINLAKFEDEIDEVILNRGYSYYKDGRVIDLEEMSPGDYEAVVEGSEDYNLSFTIKNHTITDFFCSCPYDMGPICKHMAAVVFYLQKEELGLEMKKKKKTNLNTPKNKKKTVAEQIEEVLEKMSLDDFKNAVRELCLNDPGFRRMFLAKHLSLVVPDSKVLYARQIKETIKSASHRRGFIDYQAARYVGNEVHSLYQNMMQLFETGRYQTVFYMACAIIEEMTKALNFADDSNGDIGGWIEPSVDLLFQLTSQSISDQFKKEIFDYCIYHFTHHLSKGWDWHYSMLYIAIELIVDQNEVQLISELLDKEIEITNTSDWERKKIESIRREFIVKTSSPEAALEFMEAHIENEDFRERLIEHAVQKKNYKKAIQLAEEGIQQDEKDKPGLADRWRMRLLGIYLGLNDPERVIYYAKYLFVNSIQEKRPLYQILKNHVPDPEWSGFVDQLLHAMKTKNRWSDFHVIADVYIEENRLSDLLNFIKPQANIHILDQYSSYFRDDLKAEFLDMYHNAILEYMINNVGRNYYQHVRNHLRKMAKAGAKEKVNQIIMQLRELYPQRKALMEELGKV